MSVSDGSVSLGGIFLSVDAPACRVLFANQLVIDQRWVWRLSDPFWRLYFNRDPGAAISRQGRRQVLPAYRAALVPAWCDAQGKPLYVSIPQYRLTTHRRQSLARGDFT